MPSTNRERQKKMLKQLTRVRVLSGALAIVGLAATALLFTGAGTAKHSNPIAGTPIAGTPSALNSVNRLAATAKSGSVAGQPASPTLKSGVSTRPVRSHLARPAAPSVVLYDQYDNDSGIGVVSQNFEAANDPFDSTLADDFVVPSGQTWNINEVDVAGQYFNGPGPAASVNVVFYSDSSGLPGSAVATRNNLAPTDTAGAFVIPIPSAVTLGAGTYWVSVQANMDFTPNGEWGWENRTVQSNSGAAWQNPGNGFGTGCTTWGRMTTCIPTAGGPDLVYRLAGTTGTGIIRYQPRARYTNADYQTGGTGLRNQRRGGITINGVTGTVTQSFVYWAILSSAPAPAHAVATLTRLWPLGSGATTTLNGVVAGSGPSPCWPPSTVTVYRAGVSSPSVIPGNGVYMIDLGDDASSTGDDPWVNAGPDPEAEGASIVVIYQGTGTTALYDGFAGITLPGGSLTYDLATGAYPGTHAHWDEIGVDGQKGSSRTATGAGTETTTVDGRPGAAAPVTVAGPGSAANDSDWNGNDSTPLPSLWDTRGHEITDAMTSGDTTVRVSTTAPGDCITFAANLLHYG
jgi:hypothetical protein